MNDNIKLVKQVKSDGWSNLFTGLGTRADKSSFSKNIATSIISDNELESIYCDDGLGAKIIDLLPEDMLKQGWHYEFDNLKEELDVYSGVYENVFENINLNKRIEQGLKWSRLYGGAILVLGALDGEQLDKPLRIKKIKTIENLKVFARTSIDFFNCVFQENPTQERFGEIEKYAVKINFNNIDKTIFIHYSRVFEFKGIEVPFKKNTIKNINEYKYWGIPVLQRVYTRLSDVGVSFGSISNLMQEITIGKYKFSNLVDILSQVDGNKLMQKRVQVMDLMKSVFHSVIIDKEDDYIRDTISFNGISDVLYQFFMLISASTGYPLTKLFGVSPAGLNSSGDSDTYSYYDNVKRKQELDLKPAIKFFCKIISEWKNIPEPKIIFNSLEQMTEKEQAELEEKKANTEKTKAETYEKYMEMGIMEPYIVEELEFGDSLKLLGKQKILPAVEEE